MRSMFNLVALSAICVITALPTVAAEIDKEQSFKRFIGFPSKDSSLPIGAIGLVEGKFQSTEPTGSTLSVSPNLSPNHKAIVLYEPLELSIVEAVYNDISQIPDIFPSLQEAALMGGRMSETKCTVEGNKITIQEVQYNPAQTHRTQAISGTLTQPIASYLDEAGKAITAPGFQEPNTLILANEADVSLLASYRLYIENVEKMRSGLNSLEKQFEDDSRNHADQVLRILRYVAPTAQIKLFSSHDYQKASADKDLDIISMSVFKSKNLFDSDIDIDGFCAFNNSNKIVVVALPNNHCQITATHPYVTLAKKAQGYHLIICSSSTYFADDQLGNTGDYLALDALKDPDMQEFLACYMTAPGFFLDFVDNTEVLNGCSLSAPLVAGAAAYLKALYPHTANARIKEALIHGARKRTTLGNPLEITEQTQKIFLETVANYGIDLSKNWENRISDEYNRVLQLIAGGNILLNDVLVHNHTVFSHVWGDKDFNKYWNHLDIERSKAYLEEQSGQSLPC